MVNVNFIPHMLEETSFDDIPDVIGYSDSFYENSPIKQVQMFGDLSQRGLDFTHALFTYTAADVRPVHCFETKMMYKNCILFVQAFHRPQEVLRYIAQQRNRGKNKIGQRILWLDLHREPMTEEETLWLEKVLKVCDIVTTGSKGIQQHYEEQPHECLFHTIESTPNATYREVASIVKLEKKAKKPRVLWCGRLEDLGTLEPVLKESQYPITACIRDNYNIEHPKIKLVKTHRKRALHYSDYLLITQPPEDPFYRVLIKESLMKGVVPLVVEKELDGDLNPYTIEIKPFNLNKSYLHDIMYMNTHVIEKTLLDGQKYVIQEHSTYQMLEALIELYQASEILIEKKKKDHTLC